MSQKSIASFGDVRAVMEKAAAAPKGIRYRLQTWGSAVNFRQRCYRFRKAELDLVRDRMGMVPGLPITTPYDSLEITIENDEGTKLIKKPTRPSAHYDIVLKHREITGQLLDLDGEILPEEEPKPQIGGLELD